MALGGWQPGEPLAGGQMCTRCRRAGRAGLLPIRRDFLSPCWARPSLGPGDTGASRPAPGLAGPLLVGSEG